MISDYLALFFTAYRSIYPKRNVGSINGIEYNETNDVETDTGICFGVAVTIQQLMMLKHGIKPELVYVWRNYDAIHGDGYEDQLVHAVLLLDGRYYDAVNTEGSADYNDIWFIRGFWLEDDHYLTYPERGDTGSRDIIPNKISPELFKAFEELVGCEIPRVDCYK